MSAPAVMEDEDDGHHIENCKKPDDEEEGGRAETINGDSSKDEDCCDGQKEPVSISHLPEELIEYIFFYLSPYRDLQSAKLVSRQWYRLAFGVIYQREQNFHDAIASTEVLWTKLLPGDGPTITDRYSHCACYYDKSLYVFGGCTSTNTTFNDLWGFDLASRQWVRPLAMGVYPSPKACATIVVYKDSLVLFGGWSHPTPSPLHQAACFFNELHIYTPSTNRWTCVTSRNLPQSVAGHSASIIKDTMIVFGGSHFPGTGSNDVWLFDFLEQDWRRIEISGPKPSPRYGQSQIVLSHKHILILGGCGGPNQIFNDAWLLVMESQDDFHWEEIRVLQTEYSAPQLWCHPACKVKDMVVVLSKPSKTMKLVPRSRSKWSHQRRQYGSAKTNRTANSATTSHLKSTPCSTEPCASTSNSWPDPIPQSSCIAEGDNPDKTAVREQDSMDTQSAFSVSVPSYRSPSSLSTSNQLAAAASSHSQCTDSFEYGFSNVHKKSNPLLSSPSNGESSSATNRQQAEQREHKDCSASSRSLQAVGGGAAVGSSNGLMPPEGAASAISPSLLSYPRPSSRQNRLKQLEVLCQYEEKIWRKNQMLQQQQQQQQHHHRPQPVSGVLRSRTSGQRMASGSNSSTSTTNSTSSSTSYKEPRSLMHVHNLDISKAITEKTVTWREVHENISDCIPEEAILYSLVEGRGELIMFGGIQRDINTMQRGIHIRPRVSNNLYVLSSPQPTF
ncbi:F-box only protein 42 [Octopus bimaculoides]|uniref:F-box domain-containing protein n=1 Tax=Octopus bimaculoides TaxID=37653 RepID=A0A0L8GHY4_OCTBM|nr:F-box only protein 42 [Octopus bimaculoides]|eukprot:XP_014780877.1 PREDICTED: F-box only protein 42-like [Octopus bimaculoides]